MQGNRVNRRFGFGFSNTTHSSSTAASSSAVAVDLTPEKNKRQSIGKGSQTTSKLSPSSNPNSTKLGKEPNPPPSPGMKTSPVKGSTNTNSVNSPSSTAENKIQEPAISSTVTTSNQPPTSTVTSTAEQSLIKVCVRIRPLLNDEVSEHIVWQWKEKTVTPIPHHLRNAASSSILDYTMANPHASFAFDHLFTPEHINSHIFDDVVRDIVSAGMNGYHGSVFTYGQTSSGKTFTMYGNPSQEGVIAQAIQYCFDSINTFPEREFLLRVSYLEVYNEQVKDLLSTESVPIRILYDPKLGTVLSGVKEHVVFNPQQVHQLIKQGEAHRHIGVTDMNAQSSRAHTLFKIIIESKERNSLKSSAVRVSTLNLVDLAGSENAKMTNSTGERAREAKHINQSLLTLSTIIQRLSEEHQKQGSQSKSSLQHLPYRDSKLTRLLETALDGNARIAIVCNISPTSRCMEESVNTLKFGARAKLIRISAKVNENIDDKTLLRAYREEIEQLKLRLKQLEEQQSIVPVSVPPAALSQHPQASASSGSLPGPASNTTMLPPPVTPSSRKQRSRSNDDNQSIEVTSATKIDIEETIHQIEDKIMQTSHIARQEDEHSKMLQMIEAMERLILKADTSKQKTRKALGVASNETVNDPPEKSMRLKDSNLNDLEAKKSFKKAPSFTSGIPMNSSRGTGIPRRAGGGSQLSLSVSVSRSSSNDKQDPGLGVSNALTKSPHSPLSPQVQSPKGLIKKRSSNSLASQSREIPAVSSSQPTDEGITTNPADSDNQETFLPLTRQASIPLSDLQQSFTRLESTAERVGVSTSHEKDIYSMSALTRDGLDRQGSISPLSMSIDYDPRYENNTTATTNNDSNANDLSRSNKTNPVSSETATERRTVPPIDTVSVSNIAGFVFSPSATINRGNLPPPSPYETPFNSAMTPMKNRLLRRVKQSEDSTDLSDQQEVMRQLAISNDTLESFNHSLASSNDLLVEDDSVLLGVSKMLTMLKDYISKTKARPEPILEETSQGPTTTAGGGIAMVTEDSQSVVSGKESVGSKTTPPKKKEASSHDVVVARDEYDKLKQDLALKEADNHFLQEELEQKDKMLGMLTEGLKEVQESQMQWLTANQELSQELEKTLLMNHILRNEILRLNLLLTETAQQQQQQQKEPSKPKPLQFISEEVVQLLGSPVATNRLTTPHYLTRTRSARSPLRHHPIQSPHPMAPLPSSGPSTPLAPVEKQSESTAQKTLNHHTPAPLLVISSPMSASSTATTTIASPDVETLNQFFSAHSVSSPRELQSVIDYETTDTIDDHNSPPQEREDRDNSSEGDKVVETNDSSDSTNLQSVEEIAEFDARIKEEEEKTADRREAELEGGEDSFREVLSPKDPSSPSRPLAKTDGEDAPVLASVEKIESTESFGEIEETW